MRAKPPSRVPSPPPTLPLRGPLGAIESPWLRIMASGVFPVARNCHRCGRRQRLLSVTPHGRQYVQSRRRTRLCVAVAADTSELRLGYLRDSVANPEPQPLQRFDWPAVAQTSNTHTPHADHCGFSAAALGQLLWWFACFLSVPCLSIGMCSFSEGLAGTRCSTTCCSSTHTRNLPPDGGASSHTCATSHTCASSHTCKLAHMRDTHEPADAHAFVRSVPRRMQMRIYCRILKAALLPTVAE